MQVSIFYTIYYWSVKPHITKTRLRLESFNDAMIMVYVYHLIGFGYLEGSEVTGALTMQFNFGFSCAGFLGIMIVGNMQS